MMSLEMEVNALRREMELEGTDSRMNKEGLQEVLKRLNMMEERESKFHRSIEQFLKSIRKKLDE